MKILVTGAAGFVGRHLVARLVDAGHQVTAVGRDAAKASAMPWFDSVRFVSQDVHALRDDPRKLFGDADAVAHLAWPGLPNYRAPYHFEETLPADYRFLKSLVLAGYRHILVAGTCFEYGMRGGPLNEEMATAPVLPYALAKDVLRRFMEALREIEPFQLQWARLFYMYGEGQHPRSLLAQLDRAIDAGEAVFDMSWGEQLRDYLPVTGVVERLALLLAQPQEEGIFNICSGAPISVRRLVEERIAERGASIRPNRGRYPYPDYEPMAFWGESNRLARLMEQAGDGK